MIFTTYSGHQPTNYMDTVCEGAPKTYLPQCLLALAIACKEMSALPQSLAAHPTQILPSDHAYRNRMYLPAKPGSSANLICHRVVVRGE